MTAPKESVSVLDAQFVLLKKCEAVLTKHEFDSLLSWIKLSIKAASLEKIVAIKDERIKELTAQLNEMNVPKNQLKD